jgi:flagellar biosynthesis protein FliQ
MTPESVVDILRHALLTALWVGAPLLLVGFVAGVLMSLLQIVTSIQDAAFNSIPRLLAFLLALILSMPWMLKKMTVYTIAILGDLGRYAR